MDRGFGSASVNESGEIETERPSATMEIAAYVSPRVWFVDVHDGGEVRRVPLTNRRVVVGSADDADLVVRDRAVSARHCVLTQVDGRMAVEDLGSKNGTYLGPARVREAWCAPGTALTIGHATLVCGAVDRDASSDELLEDDEAAFRPLPGVVGHSPAIRRMAAQVRRLAKVAMPVLIAGETGTGKELVARALHQEGPRASGPFVPMNVSALPRELVESELFGHERGAFTGAVNRRLGAFSEAEGGTLFLDEIGELPLDAQPKLLRALDGYEVRRVGGAGGGRRANVRVVAATHVPLEERVEAGLFRRDLFHRLEVFVVPVPALRERLTDIGPIARVMLRDMATDLGIRELSVDAISRLQSHGWPGNVRELRNVLMRAADAADDDRVLDARAIERGLRVRESRPPMTFTPQLAKVWLAQHGGNLSAAARAAGYARTTFRKFLME